MVMKETPSGGFGPALRMRPADNNVLKNLICRHAIGCLVVILFFNLAL